MSSSALRLPPGWRLAAFDEIGSTNDEAKRLAAGGVAEGQVVWAKRQSAGRGREDRSWDSADGNLFCSILLRPGGPVPELSFAAGIAAAEALFDGGVSLKWPNDVLLNGRKVAGILLEGSADWMVIGIGINLVSHPEGTPFPATSLQAETGRIEQPAAILENLCMRLASWYRLWKGNGFAPVREAWLGYAHPPGTELIARTPTSTTKGRFKDLDEDGTLILETPDGRLHRVAAGDVYFAPRE